MRGRAHVLSFLLLLHGATGLGCGAGDPSDRPHGIVLLVLDTLRADGLSSYGNPRATSPVIDRVAGDGVLFEQAVSHAAWTLPGVAGLLSGRYPSQGLFSDGRLQSSLVGQLRAAGYETAAFTEGAYVSRHYGVSLGFDSFWEREGETRLDHTEAQTLVGGIDVTFDAAIEWLRDNAEDPFFLMVHTYEPHLPYKRPEYTRDLPSGTLSNTYQVYDSHEVRAGAIEVGETEQRYVRALYDGGVRLTDIHVGRLLYALDELDLSSRTVVAITSDHGEDLGGRNPRHLGLHRHHLYDELLLVPLIIYDPRTDYPVRRVRTQVRLVDVLPTLLDLAGVEAAPDSDGRSLLPLMRGEETEDRPAFATLATKRRTLAAMRVDGKKVIVRQSQGRGKRQQSEYYDLVADPGERTDLSDRGGPAQQELLKQLEAQLARLGSGLQEPLKLAEPDAALRAQLEALGYLDDAPADDGAPADDEAQPAE